MKFLSLVVYLVLSITSGVLAQDKTLTIIQALFQATPETRAREGSTGSEITSVTLQCIIEEDNLGFQLTFQAPDLERMLSNVQLVS